MPESLLVILGVAVVIVLIAVAIRAEKARQERLKAFAEASGYAFYPSGDPSGEPQGCSFSLLGTGYGSWYQRFEGFSPFGAGHSQSASNLFTKEDGGRAWHFFDYMYKTGSGKHETTSHFWVAVAEMRCSFPRLSIRQEGFLDKVGAAIGFKDIDFESNDFNERFHVTSPDERFAYAVVHPQMMEFLLSGFDAHVQLGGPYLLLHDSGSLDVGMIEPTRRAMSAFLEHVPDYVWKDHGAY